MLFKKVVLTIFFCLFSNIVSAGTISILPPVTFPGTPTEPLDIAFENNITVEGNLYLDFSLWGNVGGIDSGEGYSYSILAPEITILGETQEPPAVLNYEVLFLDNTPTELDLIGNYILFSNFTIASSSFTSTESVYVGNFSQYSPVPVPGSALLFASGLLGLVRYRRVDS